MLGGWREEKGTRLPGREKEKGVTCFRLFPGRQGRGPRSQEVGEGGTIPNGTLLLLFDLFHAELFSERYWREPRSEVREGGTIPNGTLLLLFDLLHAELFSERHWREPRSHEVGEKIEPYLTVHCCRCLT